MQNIRFLYFFFIYFFNLLGILVFCKLKETNFTKLCKTKSMMTVNDSFPGPVIRIHRGDLVYINVHNQDDFGVTIHWYGSILLLLIHSVSGRLIMRMLWCRHGVKQTRNPWSDGPDHITQCKIQPGTNFTYKVIFGEDQEGTLWWHAHSDWTRASVHGAIVILPTEGTTYPFPKPDGDHLLVLGTYSQTSIYKYLINYLSRFNNKISFTGSVSPYFFKLIFKLKGLLKIQFWTSIPP